MAYLSPTPISPHSAGIPAYVCIHTCMHALTHTHTDGQANKVFLLHTLALWFVILQTIRLFVI